MKRALLTLISLMACLSIATYSPSYSKRAEELSPEQPASLSPANLPKGVYQTADCDKSIGWTCDADNYSQALSVHFYADGAAGLFLGAVTANIVRGAAVTDQCGGRAAHGFSFKTPETLKDGIPHTIYAYAINIGPAAPNPLLQFSPRTITCAPPVTAKLSLPRYPLANPGSSFNLTYNWQATPTSKPYTVFVHFLDSTGAIAFQDDHQPPTPTSQWSGAVTYSRAVAVPATAFGSYRIMVGLYDPSTGFRVKLTPAAEVVPDNEKRYHIGTLRVGTAVGYEPVGPVELVRSYAPQNRCDGYDIPDAPAHAFRNASGQVNFISASETNYRMLGSSLNNIQRSCPVIFNSTRNPAFNAFTFGEWITSSYTLDGQKIYGLVHNEWYAYLIDPRCPGGSSRGYGWVNSITLVTSNDGGATYSHPPDYIVVRPYVMWDTDDSRFTCSQTQPTVYGLFQPSKIIKKENYYYAMYQAERDPLGSQDWGACLMRTQNLDSASAWEVWVGNGWNTSLGVPCAPVSRNAIEKMHESVTFNSYLNKYVLVGLKYAPRPGIYFSTSSDLINWSSAVMLAPLNQRDRLYPSLLDPTDTTRNFENTGREPYLYYVNGDAGPNLLRQKIRFIP